MHTDRFDALTRKLVQTRSRRQVLTGLVTALLGTSLVDAAAQGNSQSAQACKQGGYTTLVRGEGNRQGDGFQTVGECVKYAAQGGTLVSRSLGGSDPCAIVNSYNPTTHLPSLSGLNLGTCDLSTRDLSGADLSYASLIGGYLPGANMTGANLTGANLYQANLNSATLVEATLIAANLDKALLSYANLSGANLSGATLNAAIWTSTTCPDGTNSDAHRSKTCLNNL